MLRAMKRLVPIVLVVLLLTGCSVPAHIAPKADPVAASTPTDTPTPKPQVAVPNVVGLTQTAAVAAITAAGMDERFNGESDGDFVVYSQTPSAGTMADAGSIVSISANPPPYVYTITGNGSTASSITYMNGSGEAQATGQQIPLSYSMPTRPTLGLIILAQDGNGTSITCTISRGGTVLATNTSTGKYAIAQCTAAP